MTALIEGDFVVFIIGMRVHKWWKLHKWLPVVFAMPAMLKELSQHPESGFLGVQQGLSFMIQYWRSTEDLIAYARAKDSVHYPAWVRFNKAVGVSGDVGIFHESYAVKAGAYENVYNNVAKFGLGKVGKLVPAKGRYGSAASRLGTVADDDAPIDPKGTERG